MPGAVAIHLMLSPVVNWRVDAHIAARWRGRGGEAPRVLPALTARVTELLQLEKYGDHQQSPVTE